MDLGIAGRKALIVGGSGLIGRAVAASLLREGATVVLAGRDQGRLDAAAADLGASSTVALDNRLQDSVTAAAEEIGKAGNVDILVNAAAPPAHTLDPALDQDPEQILAAVDAKTIGYLRTMHALLPGMRDRGFGRVVNISGQNAFTTRTVVGTVRNSAVITASKALADAYAGSGVTINVVNPAIVTATPRDTVEPAAGGDSTPEQVAALVTYLVSSHAAAITGESIAVGHRVWGVQ
ncbi:short-chain dehydrogenase [Actinoplanes sp. OR16]|uniref:SDR family NAD(P)-dependent oxidoreductase n=1 Tax=Actinoplanes sp. OR16 TaxID=946334 RepID=UPI000F6C75CE|nr:SDR family NAD(P)-dependent oxidoreductase [Actinoplanes sp. OR16]BBH69036.1 short-chain dehydrogenase [Actinoplanes sp. OR16]